MKQRSRRFLFLQGPHGPFFDEFAARLRECGSSALRIGVNQGDQNEWSCPKSYTPFKASLREWRDFLSDYITRKEVTDLVLYGDTRRLHTIACDVAARMGVTTHVFEEGYVRPQYVTYERGGVNGYSRLIRLHIDDINQEVLSATPPPNGGAAGWGATREHIIWSLRYHNAVLFNNQDYPLFKSHRKSSLKQEYWTWTKRVLSQGVVRLRRRTAQARLEADPRPRFLALLQLGADPSMSTHSGYSTVEEFVRHCMSDFAAAGRDDAILAFKAHPLEDGAERLHKRVKQLAREYGVSNQVMYVDGGKLGEMLNHPKVLGSLTVNSTALQQCLWRGKPTMALGRSIFRRPGLTSQQPSAREFFRAPEQPNVDHVRLFQRFLETTCQIKGAYYSADGRRSCLDRVIDKVLAPHDPYEPFLLRGAPL